MYACVRLPRYIRTTHFILSKLASNYFCVILHPHEHSTSLFVSSYTFSVAIIRIFRKWKNILLSWRTLLNTREIYVLSLSLLLSMHDRILVPPGPTTDHVRIYSKFVTSAELNFSSQWALNNFYTVVRQVLHYSC